jgi:galactitol-specific phosphotransferase system IIB component
MFNLDRTFKVLWTLALLIFIAILLRIFYLYTLVDYKSIIELLAPLGILISAKLASLSVMKSIENTKRIEIEKKHIDEINFKKKKLEDLFVLVEKLNENYSKESQAKLLMLMKLYFPQLKDILREFLSLNIEYHNNPSQDNKVALDFITSSIYNNKIETIIKTNFNQECKQL